jgi:hypothetical protein
MVDVDKLTEAASRPNSDRSWATSGVTSPKDNRVLFDGGLFGSEPIRNQRAEE